jgi:hypothetical protein
VSEETVSSSSEIEFIVSNQKLFMDTFTIEPKFQKNAQNGKIENVAGWGFIGPYQGHF